MHLEVIAIEQRLDLSTRQSVSYAVVRLPDGQEVKLAVDDAAVEALLTSVVKEEAATPTPPVQVQEALVVKEAAPAAVPISTINWRELPDAVLPPPLKIAFGLVNAPDEMGESAFLQLIESVHNTFTADDWKEVERLRAGGVVTLPEPEPPAPNSPAFPKDVVVPNAQFMMGLRRAKTVPADEMGYPIVPARDTALVSIVGGAGGDEDGVGQL